MSIKRTDFDVGQVCPTPARGRKIVAFLEGHPEEAFTIGELHELVGYPPAADFFFEGLSWLHRHEKLDARVIQSELSEDGRNGSSTFPVIYYSVRRTSAEVPSVHGHLSESRVSRDAYLAKRSQVP